MPSGGAQAVGDIVFPPWRVACQLLVDFEKALNLVDVFFEFLNWIAHEMRKRELTPSDPKISDRLTKRVVCEHRAR